MVSEEKVILLQEKLTLEKELYCSGLSLSARWFVVGQTQYKGLNFIILPDQESAEYCAADLYHIIEGDKVFFLPHSGKNIEKSNYQSTLRVQRTSALGKIKEHRPQESLFIVSYPFALEEKILSMRHFKPLATLNVGQEISHETITNLLYKYGFERVDFVSDPGQYAIRGGIIDIFSYSMNQPYRLAFFGNEIEKISVFDCNTQLSIENISQADIYPSFFTNEEENKEFILENLPKDALFWLESVDLYKENSFYPFVENYRRVFLTPPVERNKSISIIPFHIAAQPVFHKNFEWMIEDIRSKTEYGYKVMVFGEKKQQLDRLSSIIIQNNGVQPEFIPGKNLHEGFIDHDSRVCCYTDHELFDRFHRVTLRRTVDKSEQLTINDLTSFSIGDYIVHIDYGVGIFGGLVKIADDKGRMHDVVKLEYKDHDVIFISIHSLHKISRYKSKDSEAPHIHKLGSKTWAATKVAAKNKVKDIAKDLIRLYAKRKATSGFAFSPDNYLQEELESSFMYEDTPDQDKAIRAVKRDMEDACPMDRLVCGDVGFGKTEIAIRAAFKAVCDSKQVAVLVPTTILCLQHYNTFTSRLENFPCRIEFVSRLRTAKEINTVQKELKAGKIDIIIGTHKLLSDQFEFKDLGLLVIDEEQKFGVSAKEKLRQMKVGVDTLALTATPIPRTLQFSLLGARDLSVIQTPPPNRIPIQTEIMNFDKVEIKRIIHYELKRGGQIFFVHNKVEELPAIEDVLHRLVPDMKICVAHGQMESRTLENKVLDFINGDYDLLLCTTIIENGLDIPAANTMIINQAQNIGLSDLHQLRGRVGRSNKQAFCYLIIPPLTSISEDSRRRLKAIETFSDLGSGFNIAMQDLDIRGAGNLLGAQQSGFISDMGLETFHKVLMEAMEELGVETGYKTTSHTESYLTDCTVETDQPALLPDTFVDITVEKIRIYKELDTLSDDRSLEKAKDRLIDRFGHLPTEVENLFMVVQIRRQGRHLGFEKIIVKNGIMIAFFISNPLSPYYKSDVFAQILDRISGMGTVFEMKQGENGKLKLIARNIHSLQEAQCLLDKLEVKEN
ncbi:MAG: transcription-repair coupling factor [Bacteroidales bacterium]|nr:transcription-repair coupling factor [Bacteroidales bacterium]